MRMLVLPLCGQRDRRGQSSKLRAPEHRPWRWGAQMRWDADAQRQEAAKLRKVLQLHNLFLTRSHARHGGLDGASILT
jgi:hypothetical protein